jgi:hypothetical protein
MKKSVSSVAHLGLVALILAVGSGSVMAQAIWKWRDKDGRIQVSDRAPPMEIPEKDILQRPHSARAPTSAASDAPADGAPAATSVDPSLEAKRKALQAEQAASAAQDKAKKDADAARRTQAKAETCARARGQLTGLESGQRYARTNDKGEREVLDDRARAEEIARTREIVNSSCN